MYEFGSSESVCARVLEGYARLRKRYTCTCTCIYLQVDHVASCMMECSYTLYMFIYCVCVPNRTWWTWRGRSGSVPQGQPARGHRRESPSTRACSPSNKSYLSSLRETAGADLQSCYIALQSSFSHTVHVHAYMHICVLSLRLSLSFYPFPSFTHPSLPPLPPPLSLPCAVVTFHTGTPS